MPLINKITIYNFKSFRKKVSFDLGNGSYFIGVNNSGKSTILNALQAFFDDSSLHDGNFINRTSFRSKGEKSNVAEISLVFDLNELDTKKFKTELIKKYGANLTITKIISVTTESKIVTYFYKIEGINFKEKLPDGIIKLLGSIRVTYLHPQEGQSLLVKAQTKLRQRLLANWGRGSNITQSINNLQKEWDRLRNQARTYLSGSLTESLQKMWPNSEISINLPKSIREIISVSDINFTGYKDAPEIELTAQGTGAQSTILYLTHFLLDSDRSLHRGEYHPLWLLEEPESFLHVDLLANLAKQLNSEKWLNNIQMVISTHSPVLLAGSRVAEEKIVWSILSEYPRNYNKPTTEYNDDEIKEIGDIMGDPNFYAYFLAAKNEPLILIEDGKDTTINKYKEAGIKITRGLNGVPDIARIIEVFLSAPFVINNKVFFIIDGDKGKSEFSRFYDPLIADKSRNGFSRFKLKNTENIYLIFLPDNFAAENLFLEFENHLAECISKLFNTTTWKLNTSSPTNLSSTVSCLRRAKITSEDEAIDSIKNKDEIKTLFWKNVEKFNYKIAEKYISILKFLLDYRDDNNLTD
ncbi:MAG: AAA family ATPase [bacterium]|nr:AAA family ATPase [bacterium]